LDLVSRRGEISAHATTLILALLVLGLAAILEPHPDVVKLFGWDVPSMCMFRNLTGHSCPGCGLTRSFSFLAHGDLRDGFHLNPLGPILFTLFAAQIPYRALRIARLVSGAPSGD
jgi:hypothetical protein